MNKNVVILLILMGLLICSISTIPIKADETNTSNIIYNNIIFKITDDMDINIERTVITSLIDKNGNDFKFEYKFKIKDYEIKEGRDINLFHGSTYYKYIELHIPIDLSNIDGLSNETYELKTDLDTSNIKYEDIKPNRNYSVSGSTVVKEDSSFNPLVYAQKWLISIICCVIALWVFCSIFKFAISKHWVPAPEVAKDSYLDIFTENNENDEDNEDDENDEDNETNIPKKIVYMCPACGQNYINFKLDGFIPHCANCGSIMIKVGEV